MDHHGHAVALFFFLILYIIFDNGHPDLQHNEEYKDSLFFTPSPTFVLLCLVGKSPPSPLARGHVCTMVKNETLLLPADFGDGGEESGKEDRSRDTK